MRAIALIKKKIAKGDKVHGLIFTHSPGLRLSVWWLTSRLRTGSQQVDDIEMMSDMNENFQLWHQGAVLAGCGSLCNTEVHSNCSKGFPCCVHVRGWREREDNILTLKHLYCNSGARGSFLDAKGGCFYHLTKRSPSQWVTFNEKQLS